MEALYDKLDRAQTGIRLYGIAPPKSSTAPERVQKIAARQVERLQALQPDGLVVYDIQDEPGRSGEPRPFPFLSTIDPETYAEETLEKLKIPKIIYRSVGARARETFSGWLDTVKSSKTPRLGVFVGAPQAGAPGLKLSEAYKLAQEVPQLKLGGIAIAERHRSKEDEHQRMLSKQARGCRFFITQTVYDSDSSKSLLSDYALECQASDTTPAPIILTFAPCGSVRTLQFMKWLGISFPRWLENELRHSSDTLERSIDLCETIFLDVQNYAQDKGLPIGINVESVSIRKAEIDASVELYQRLSKRLVDTL